MTSERRAPALQVILSGFGEGRPSIAEDRMQVRNPGEFPRGDPVGDAIASLLESRGIAVRFEPGPRDDLASTAAVPLPVGGEATASITPTVIVLSSDADVAETAIANYKSIYINSIVIAVSGRRPSEKINEGDWFPRPFRLGAIVQRIEWNLRRISRLGGLPESIALGEMELDLRGDLLRSAQTGQEFRLTEKERDILLTLYRAGPAGVDRKTLLQAVWNYARGVETHTLETHIYRLRQKIEPDPTSPKIVCTAGAGYVLGIFRK